MEKQLLFCISCILIVTAVRLFLLLYKYFLEKRHRDSGMERRRRRSEVTAGTDDTIARRENINTGQRAGNVSNYSAGKNETGVMIYYANDRHGSADKEYRFKYKKIGNSWRAYILKMPDLAGREAGGFVTHRFWDNGSPYICWNRPIASLREMQSVSRVWADNIQEYIATGKRFG